MSFTPAGYKLPETSKKYFRPKDGDNRIRILGDAIVGYEAWTEKHNGKTSPVRHRIDPETGYALPFTTTEIDMDKKIKHFWAFPIWNVDEKLVQVYQITQKSIMERLMTLTQDEDWGDPTGYGLIITRTGEELNTKYQVTPKPKAPLPAEALEAWEKVKPTFNLERLYDNGDPFEESKGTTKSRPADLMEQGMTSTEEEIDVSSIPF